MNKQILKSKMSLYGDKLEDVAKIIGTSTSTASIKMNGKGGRKFNVDEINVLRDRYHLTNDELVAIFFD